nr:hypothetical protein [Tanacetum cinerariifolium]
MNDAGTKVGPTLTDNTSGMSSYANVTGVPSRKALNFCTLFRPAGNRVDVVVLVESISAVSERFSNTAYCFFLEKRVAYPVFANYVRNTWGKYGLVKSMLNVYRDILFPNPDVNLLKEDVDNVLVWVKLNGVLVTAFSEDCLSAIATKLDSNVVKKMKKPSQYPRGVPIGPKVTLVDDESKPLAKVDSSDDHDSEDEIASINNETANFMASKKVDYGANSLLEQ